MKYKFYDDPPHIPEKCFQDAFVWGDIRAYTKEVNWIAKNLDLKVSNFTVDDEAFSDPVLFYAGRYFGYLDDRFYFHFSTNDFEGWWGFDN